MKRALERRIDAMLENIALTMFFLVGAACWVLVVATFWMLVFP